MSMIRFIELHRKAIAALVSSAILEGITEGLLTGKWAAVGHLIVVVGTTAGVFASPANND